MSTVRSRKSRKQSSRKPKFQADLAPVEDRIVRSLKQELQLSSNSDFLAEALALFQWAVAERKRGHKIISESTTGDKQVLVLPKLERVAPGFALPYVSIDWTPEEVERLLEVSAAEPIPPTEALVRMMRG